MKKFVTEDGFWSLFPNAKIVQDNLGETCKISILDINNKEVTIE